MDRPLSPTPVEPAAPPAPSGVDVLLADGTIASIRPLAASDHDALISLHEQVSDDNIRYRFFTLGRGTGRKYVDHLIRADPQSIVTLVAQIEDNIVAIASGEVIVPDTAEVSFLVADGAHGIGLGTILLEHLAALARDRGIRRFVADVLADNRPMLGVLRDAGFDVDRRIADGVVTLRLSTAATSAAIDAADKRECLSEARSLRPMLAPRSVVLIGVRRSGEGVGAAVLSAVLRGGFSGEVFVVHPHADEIAGVAAYPSVGAIDRPIDLAVIAVPAAEAVVAAREAAEAGTRVAVVLSSGFGEIGPHGGRMQHELVTSARRHSMRVVGPNCLGVMANSSEIRLNATFTRDRPSTGGLAIASQSGGVGIALLDLVREAGLGVGSFVSLGNKADVSGNDLLAAWMDDERVKAAVLYLESFGNPQKFARLARRFAERKPLIAVVGGRSIGGQRAGASHTAASAAPGVGVDALFTQAGVIDCTSLASVVDVARLLVAQPLPEGPRVGIVGNAGGLGVLAADAATASGLSVPELSNDLRRRLDEHGGSHAGVSNPVDLGAAAGVDDFTFSLDALLASDEVDAVLGIVAGTAVTDVSALFDSLRDRRMRSLTKPLLLVATGTVEVPRSDGGAWTRFRSVEEAADALGHAVRYAAWRSTPRGLPEPDDPETVERAHAIAARGLHARAPDGWQPVSIVRELLGCFGIDAPTGEVARGASEAAAVAERNGFPVVVKLADPAVLHKTDRGLVRTGVASVAEVEAAVAAFEAELATSSPEVLVQPEVTQGVEVAVGVIRDRNFGPLVMVAAGGVAIDVWADRVFLMPPITAGDAARAVRALRIWPLLAGYRGFPPTDVAALEGLVVRVGRVATDVPHVTELDLNPVIVGPNLATCVDAKLRLQVPSIVDGGVPRRLRAPH
jgi:acyl-CoA synthetase (NDP forming)/GNAT superfamily N-acetyltransferase